MACGIPVIGSAVGANINAVPPTCGILASSTDEWLNALRKFAYNPQMRSSMGKASREWVESRYSLRSALPKLIDVIRRVAEASQDRSNLV